jgi:hypothetical protein
MGRLKRLRAFCSSKTLRAEPNMGTRRSPAAVFDMRTVISEPAKSMSSQVRASSSARR